MIFVQPSATGCEVGGAKYAENNANVVKNILLRNVFKSASAGLIFAIAHRTNKTDTHDIIFIFSNIATIPVSKDPRMNVSYAGISSEV